MILGREDIPNKIHLIVASCESKDEAISKIDKQIEHLRVIFKYRYTTEADIESGNQIILYSQLKKELEKMPDWKKPIVLKENKLKVIISKTKNFLKNFLSPFETFRF